MDRCFGADAVNGEELLPRTAVDVEHFRKRTLVAARRKRTKAFSLRASGEVAGGANQAGQAGGGDALDATGESNFLRRRLRMALATWSNWCFA